MGKKTLKGLLPGHWAQGAWLLGSYSAVVVVVEDLGGQRDSVARFHLSGNILPHPHAVILIAGDVQLGVVHLQSLQEAHHILLFLFDLEGDGEAQRSGSSSQAQSRQIETNTCLSFKYQECFYRLKQLI